MALVKLMYMSKMVDDFQWSEMPALVERASECNKQLEITGVLVSYNREIIQVLEGSAIVVTSLFSRILQDTRHKEVQTLSVEQVEKREFSKWGMKEISIERISNDDPGWLKQFLKNSDKNHYYLPEKYDAVYALLRAVYQAARE